MTDLLKRTEAQRDELLSVLKRLRDALGESDLTTSDGSPVMMGVIRANTVIAKIEAEMGKS